MGDKSMEIWKLKELSQVKIADLIGVYPGWLWCISKEPAIPVGCSHTPPPDKYLEIINVSSIPVNFNIFGKQLFVAPPSITKKNPICPCMWSNGLKSNIIQSLQIYHL